MKYSRLFVPGRIGRMEVKNRLVMPPMVRNYADTKGYVTQRYCDHIASIAAGGVGLMILEASFISPEGKGFMNELGVHEDGVVFGLKKLARAAQSHGAKIGIQLYHAGRQTSFKVTGMSSVAPSPIPDPTVNEVPHELTIGEIRELVGKYAAAATRAKKAGLDFVEIHGAHGYLITQFLSPFSNRREDAYGGTTEKRFRFLREVFTSVRNAVGGDFPICVRLSADELVMGGLAIADTMDIAQRLEKLGADAVHISVGNYASYVRGYMIPPMAVEDGPLLRYAAQVKATVRIPVIAVGKLRTPEIVDEALVSGSADFVAIGRTLLADPEWPNKVREGRIHEINTCIACNQGCIERLFEQKDVWCTVNSATGREALFTKKKNGRKDICIVGGGPAGLEAARVAAQRGHHVVIFEKSSRLGGQLISASVPPFRTGWEEFRQVLIRDMKRLGVEVRLNTEFVPSMALKERFDLAIIAMGSSPIRPKIPGIGRTNVVVARDVFEGKAKVRGRVVVAGGGCMGAQTAEHLASKGHKVTIVEATGEVALEAPSDDRALLLGRLKKIGVQIMTNTKVMSIGTKSIVTEGYLGSKSLPADTVVVCLGAFPDDGIADELKGYVRKVITVGDAKDARRVTEAVIEGGLAALEV